MMRVGRDCSSGLLLLFVIACGVQSERPREAVVRPDHKRLSFSKNPESLSRALAVPADSLRAAGEERYARQSYDSARAIWEVELVRARSAGDSAAEARVRMWLGLAAWRLGDYAEARREGEAALALKQRHGLDAELSRSFNALGLLSWNEGKHREALRHFDSAIASARRHGDAAGIARAAGNIPLVRTELGDFDGARRGFETALTGGRAIGDRRVQGNALANMAMLEVRLGNPARAVSLLSDARGHYGAMEYATGEANALGQLATAWSALGDLQRAIVTADSGLAIARKHGLQQEIASTLAVLADLQVQAGSPRLALRLLSEADHINQTLSLEVERGNNLRRSSAILLELGETETAIARARAALAVHRAVEARSEEVYDRAQLAHVLSRAGNIAAADAEADTASRRAAGLGNPSAVRTVAVTRARLALDRRNPAAALRILSGIDTSRAYIDWRPSDLRAEALFALGRMPEARRESERAIAGMERERASLGVGPLRSTYLANRAGPFSRLVAVDLALGDTVAAFRTAASVPGRNLAERLRELATSSPKVTAATQAERLLIRAAALETELAAAAGQTEGAERRETLQRELRSTQAAYEDYLTRRATLPGADMLATSIEAKQVMDALGENDAVLTFLSGPAYLDVFVVRRRSVSHRKAALGERALTTKVRLARELLTRAGSRVSAEAALTDLHDLLIRPAVIDGALQNVSRMWVVPHAALGALPFSALRDRTTRRFLVQDLVVTTLPSVAAFNSRRTVRGTPVRGIMIFAPIPDSLPGTGQEAELISRLIPGAERRLGNASSEGSFRAALQRGRPLHVASHGANNLHNPLFSRMVVGRPQSGSRNDGHIEVHEILDLQTSSPLVFLSGCETALGSGDFGSFADRSDAASLAQAFMAAGAGSVVATLWKVDDSGARALAESFYRGLLSGSSPSAALAAAQRSAISAKSSFTWAAYTVSEGVDRKPADPVRRTRTEPQGDQL